MVIPSTSTAVLPVLKCLMAALLQVQRVTAALMAVQCTRGRPPPLLSPVPFNVFVNTACVVHASLSCVCHDDNLFISIIAVNSARAAAATQRYRNASVTPLECVAP